VIKISVGDAFRNHYKDDNIEEPSAQVDLEIMDVVE